MYKRQELYLTIRYTESMLKQIQRPFNVFLLLILVSLLGYGFNIANNGSETSKKGSFHIHQSIHNQWEEMFVEPYSVTYQTKSFQLTPQDNTVKIRIKDVYKRQVIDAIRPIFSCSSFCWMSLRYVNAAFGGESRPSVIKCRFTF